MCSSFLPLDVIFGILVELIHFVQTQLMDRCGICSYLQPLTAICGILVELIHFVQTQKEILCHRVVLSEKTQAFSSRSMVSSSS